MPYYKLVIFDFDGTLCDTYEAIITCVEATYRTLQQPTPSRNTIDQVVRMSLGMEETVALLSPKATSVFRDQLIRCYEAIYLAEGEARGKPFDGAEALLSQLQAAGIMVAVVSNKAATTLETALKRFRLKQYLSISVGAEQGMEKKPSAMVYHAMIKPRFPELGSHQILMVGDSSVDLRFAHNIGCDTCWAAYGYGTKAECLKLKPSHTIQQLGDLSKIVLPPT